MLKMPIALPGALFLWAATASVPAHVAVSATFVPPAKPGEKASVEVRLVPRDPDVRVNEEPAPRLKLDAGQALLIDRQPPAPRSRGFDPATARYLDPALPVHFRVALSPSAPRGRQTVKAQVTYYYCSKREGWCRRGTSDVEIDVNVEG